MTMSEFDAVAPPLAVALEKRGYENLTPVQNAVLEEDLQSSDLLVSAQTGSGKTIAFGMAIAPAILESVADRSRPSHPAALIVAPTRELALQVKRELEWLFGETRVTIASCVGGMDIRTERRALERGADIVVGTPGRLRDHIMRNALKTEQMQAVVLDEADEMLDLGFREDLEYILETTPDSRRTLLFSATVPAEIAKLAKNFQRDAVRISTQEEQKQHGDIKYRVLVTAPREKENAIINVLRYYEAKNALVFCNTRAAVNHMVSRFNNRGFSVVALSGELSQSERNHALQALRDGRARVCIATDVAARGIDLPNLELVVHADLPNNPETLLHRSGRTGRAGNKGVSALIVDIKGRNRAERLLRFAKINAEWDNPPSADAVNQRDEKRLSEDPLLTEPAHEEEQAFASRILQQFSPEQVAAAFVRLSRAGKSAPEDIAAVSVSAPEKRPFKKRNETREGRGASSRREFDESVWVSLSVGRKQRAEPRWLIPLICNGGGIGKSDIGVIKMQANETFVQIDAERAPVFFDALGAGQALEKNVRVKRLDKKPKFDAAPGEGSDKKPYRPGEKSGKPKRKFADKKKPDASFSEKPRSGKDGTKKKVRAKKKAGSKKARES